MFSSQTTTPLWVRLNRLVLALAQARFFTISVALHIFLVLGLATLVLFRPPPEVGDFTTGGGEGFLSGSEAGPAGAPMPAQPETPTMELPSTGTATPESVVTAITHASAKPATFALAAGISAPGAIGMLPGAGGQTSAAGGGGGGIPGLAAQRARAVRSRLNVFGLQAEGERIVFMVDISGSMVSMRDGKSEATYRRLEKEIASAIRNLDERSQFNVITFAGLVAAFAPDLVTATSNNKTRAIRWLGKEGPYAELAARKPPGKHDGTNAGGAVELGLPMRPDIVYFASDGSPKGAGPAQIFEMIERHVAATGVPLKVFSVSYKSGGDDGGKQFMRGLAERTGGSFTEVE